MTKKLNPKKLIEYVENRYIDDGVGLNVRSPGLKTSKVRPGSKKEKA